uniref:Uncharacterized protein n=1 Tax=Candidatus Kentrum sp. FW TaxID=2126338 RepID=A0A450U480_9GAMM|nr:MAG: hypothetical protein BECKFW1821C_GA0114237_11712 [Candidatus Kentron sp. FW]
MIQIRVISLLVLVFVAGSIGLFLVYSYLAITHAIPNVFALTNIPDLDSVKAELVFAGIMSLSTACGIFSKFLYDHLIGVCTKSENKEAFIVSGLKSLVISLILSPVIVGGFFDKLLSAESFAFSLVFCYQNGFFLQTIIGGSNSGK